MRDQLHLNNFNALPIVKDEMSGLAVATCIKGYAPNISNGYYGFQPAVQKNNERCDQHEQMEVTENETRRLQDNCRKRAWDCKDITNFKKRRENG